MSIADIYTLLQSPGHNLSKLNAKTLAALLEARETLDLSGVDNRPLNYNALRKLISVLKQNRTVSHLQLRYDISCESRHENHQAYQRWNTLFSTLLKQNRALTEIIFCSAVQAPSKAFVAAVASNPVIESLLCRVTHDGQAQTRQYTTHKLQSLEETYATLHPDVQLGLYSMLLRGDVQRINAKIRSVQQALERNINGKSDFRAQTEPDVEKWLTLQVLGLLELSHEKTLIEALLAQRRFDLLKTLFHHYPAASVRLIQAHSLLTLLWEAFEKHYMPTAENFPGSVQYFQRLHFQLKIGKESDGTYPIEQLEEFRASLYPKVIPPSRFRRNVHLSFDGLVAPFYRAVEQGLSSNCRALSQQLQPLHVLILFFTSRQLGLVALKEMIDVYNDCRSAEVKQACYDNIGFVAQRIFSVLHDEMVFGKFPLSLGWSARNAVPLNKQIPEVTELLNECFIRYLSNFLSPDVKASVLSVLSVCSDRSGRVLLQAEESRCPALFREVLVLNHHSLLATLPQLKTLLLDLGQTYSNIIRLISTLLILGHAKLHPLLLSSPEKRPLRFLITTTLSSPPLHTARLKLSELLKRLHAVSDNAILQRRAGGLTRTPSAYCDSALAITITLLNDEHVKERYAQLCHLSHQLGDLSQKAVTALLRASVDYHTRDSASIVNLHGDYRSLSLTSADKGLALLLAEIDECRLKCEEAREMLTLTLNQALFRSLFGRAEDFYNYYMGVKADTHPRKSKSHHEQADRQQAKFKQQQADYLSATYLADAPSERLSQTRLSACYGTRLQRVALQEFVSLVVLSGMFHLLETSVQGQGEYYGNFTLMAKEEHTSRLYSGLALGIVNSYMRYTGLSFNAFIKQYCLERMAYYIEASHSNYSQDQLDLLFKEIAQLPILNGDESTLKEMLLKPTSEEPGGMLEDFHDKLLLKFINLMGVWLAGHLSINPESDNVHRFENIYMHNCASLTDLNVLLENTRAIFYMAIEMFVNFSPLLALIKVALVSDVALTVFGNVVEQAFGKIEGVRLPDPASVKERYLQQTDRTLLPRLLKQLTAGLKYSQYMSHLTAPEGKCFAPSSSSTLPEEVLRVGFFKQVRVDSDNLVVSQVGTPIAEMIYPFLPSAYNEKGAEDELTLNISTSSLLSSTQATERHGNTASGAETAARGSNFVTQFGMMEPLAALYKNQITADRNAAPRGGVVEEDDATLVTPESLLSSVRFPI